MPQVFSPNKVAASEALRLNWDSRNLGPKVDMPAMSVASVAPARQSRTNAGFFRRSQMELDGEERRDRGSEWARAGCVEVLFPWSHPPEDREALGLRGEWSGL